ncbi:MAG: hypothetical protein A2261_03380 [Candidatus Magasanikbacteria bacterium RIFOXYA2_FULL_44_8]|uniref:Uncharacterized protein n=1 Tax=Candidatus Magasanikbacteria bacterium RIFOXYA2_FULL_44_8 TaxID=1798696 RepID=A0A1F6NIK7_9BACT|nr:MAG: hypothetical protein A2261_03380 [Candidatus Magasanikbacteria bacterium RIFOXYA2_FULL_44_8]
MQILRKYQLDIIFLFFAFLLLTWAMFYFLKFIGVDPHTYEWYIVAPILILYVVGLVRVRTTIAIADRRYLTGKSLAYWIALGVIIFASYETPVAASDYWSINALYLAFTLFLADSYWDFRAMKFENIFRKK